MKENEKVHAFIDQLLLKAGFYHEFHNSPMKEAKATGQYRLRGVVFHKGDYYHATNKGHLHDCLGEFMSIVYKKEGEWLKFYRGNVQRVEINECNNPKYWGQKGEFTPVLLLYRQVRTLFIKLDDLDESNQMEGVAQFSETGGSKESEPKMQ